MGLSNIRARYKLVNNIQYLTKITHYQMNLLTALDGKLP